MDFWIILGAVGSVASLIGLILPLQTKNQRLLHVTYGLVITAITSVAVWYWQANQRIHKVEQAASRLIENEGSAYTSAGFIQAALAFLEKNKDLYPDSYARAQEICKLSDCLNSKYNFERSNSLEYAFNQNNVTSALKGLVHGISRLEGGP